MRNLVLIILAVIVAGGGAVFYFSSSGVQVPGESEHERLLKDAQAKNKQFYNWPKE